MKKIYILLISVVFLLVGCKDFLNLKPRDTRVVSTIEDYRDIMANYLYFIKKHNPEQMPVFGTYYITPKLDVAKRVAPYTGEIGISRSNTYFFDTGTGLFTTAGLNMQTWLNTEDLEWRQFYSFLGPINMVVNGVQVAEGSNENLRQYVLGEALVWRSFSYYKLLQYYAPYNNDAYGIPICLDPTNDIGNVMPKRETQKTCYKQIIGDLNWSLDLLTKTVITNEWNFTFRRDFINAMLASIYTYKAMSAAAEPSDWENAQKHAQIAIGTRVLTADPQVIRNMFNCGGDMFNVEMVSDEYFIRIMDGDKRQLCNFAEVYNDGSINSGVVPEEYAKLYTSDDIRKKAYFVGETADKYSMSGKIGGGCAILFRLAEMYLIKAEALLRQNKVGEAKSVMDEFCSRRYTSAQEIPSDPTALLDRILLERKKEFFLENDFRWLDMKRLGLTREILVNGEIQRLESNDFRYSFPIPQQEMKDNKSMVQTPGWENFLLN